jgi:multidrug efflux system outer membrane protein
VLFAASGCATVGPNYRRPDVQPPPVFRGASAEGGDAAGAAPGVAGVAAAPAATAQTAASLGDAQWMTLFADDTLRELITATLAENYDVRRAAARVMQAEAAVGITRSNEFPSVDGRAAAQGQRTSVGTSDGEARTGGVLQIGGAVTWLPDFWGRYRRASEAARAQMLATEWGRRAVIASVVSAVASGYFELRSLDLELEIATRTLATREESLRLTQVREQGGATSLVDVRQAEQLVFGARATIVDLRGSIEQQENFLSLLSGRNPGAIERGRALVEQPHGPEVPAGLPSDLLTRRPDIQQAEQQIIAANAGIGIARANYFPQIALTGSGGIASSALSALFSGPAAAWTAAASATQPIFNAGRTRSQVALAEAERDEATLEYQQTIQRAFREVSDALVDYRSAREVRGVQEQLVAAAQDARRLADLRYQGGAASYLEVLDSDTRLFSAELGLARARLRELTAFVEIYRALGGGWQG